MFVCSKRMFRLLYRPLWRVEGMIVESFERVLIENQIITIWNPDSGWPDCKLSFSWRAKPARHFNSLAL